MKKQNQDLISKEEFDKLQEEFNALKDLGTQMEGQLKRAVADYQNLEKRVVEGRGELATWATAELLKKMLPVVDSFEKVVNLGRPVLSEHNESKEWFRGVEMALKQLQQVLKEEGLEEIKIDPSTSLGTGSQFDPSLHEAIDSKIGEEGKILDVAAKGYTLNGKIIRPASVVVGRKGEKI